MQHWLICLVNFYDCDVSEPPTVQQKHQTFVFLKIIPRAISHPLPPFQILFTHSRWAWKGKHKTYMALHVVLPTVLGNRDNYMLAKEWEMHLHCVPVRDREEHIFRKFCKLLPGKQGRESYNRLAIVSACFGLTLNLNDADEKYGFDAIRNKFDD